MLSPDGTRVTVTIEIPVDSLKRLHQEAEFEGWYRKPTWQALAKEIDRVRKALLS